MAGVSGPTRRTTITVAALVALAIGGVVLAKVARGGDDLREIRLVVRGMTYYVENAREANPTLHLKRGEKIRLALTNDDPGYSHNLESPILGVSTPLLRHGQSQSIEFTVPDVPGLSSYSCEPHAEMMKGTIEIE